MKNLKKVLALVLAFACAFTMFAGAAFTDSADITQTEAVDMLAALNVIDGYEDGSYRPDDVVTRAEMAKMIYVIRNGGSDVVTQYEGYKTPFADVENVNHWAKGYIAYCYANGIISGKTATSFDPDATVTGTEAAKMALVLIGYDPTKAGLEGSAWATNTINLATKKDLFADYTISITAGCDRQFAAQLLYNTLWACTVRWSSDAEGYEDVVVSDPTGDGVTAKLLNVTVAKKYMGLEEAIGYFLGDNKINTGLKANQSSVIFNDYGPETITFVPDNGNEWVGEAVKVLYKENKNGSTGPDDKDTIYGMTLTTDTSVVNAILGDIGDWDNTKPAKIDIDGTKYDVDGDLMMVIDNYNVDKRHSENAEDFTAAYKKDSADTVKFVLNETGKVIMAFVNHVDFYQVSGLTASKITLAGLGALDIDDQMDLDSNVAKDDIVAVTMLYGDDYKDDDSYFTITKADVVEDVTVTDMKSNTEVKIDGAYAKYAAINDKVTNYDGNYEKVAALDSTYDFVMYNGYWVAAKKISASSKDIALLTGVGSDGLDNRVKVMKSDGTETTYALDDDDKDASTYDQVKDKTTKLFSFSLVGDNSIQLKNTTLKTDDGAGSAQEVVGLKFVATASEASYNKDNKTITVGTKSYVTADEAVAYIYVTGDDNYAYQIDSLKSFEDATNVEYVLDTGSNEIVAFYGELAEKPGATASSAQYGYIVDDPATASIDGTKYWTISVWNGTETVSIRVEGSTVKANVKKGAFIEYALSGDGVAESNDIIVLTEGNIGAVYNYNSSRALLTLCTPDTKGDGSNTYAVSDDVVIIGVNTKDKELVEGYDAVIASKDKDGNYLANIVYVLNSDKEVVAIFTDSENVLSNTALLPSGDAHVQK